MLQPSFKSPRFSLVPGHDVTRGTTAGHENGPVRHLLHVVHQFRDFGVQLLSSLGEPIERGDLQMGS